MSTWVECTSRAILALILYGLMCLMGAPAWAALAWSMLYAQIALPDGFSKDKEPSR